MLSRAKQLLWSWMILIMKNDNHKNKYRRDLKLIMWSWFYSNRIEKRQGTERTVFAYWICQAELWQRSQTTAAFISIWKNQITLLIFKFWVWNSLNFKTLRLLFLFLQSVPFTPHLCSQKKAKRSVQKALKWLFYPKLMLEKIHKKKQLPIVN